MVLIFHLNDENVFHNSFLSVCFFKGSEFSRFGGSGFSKSEVKEAICTVR